MDALLPGGLSSVFSSADKLLDIAQSAASLAPWAAAVQLRIEV